MTHALRALALLSVLGVVPVGTAQANPGETATSARNEARAPAPNGAAMLAEARAVHRRGELSSRDVAALLDEARAWRDARFERCLDRRLSEINAHLRTIQDRYGHMERAVTGGDLEAGRRFLSVIETLGRRVTEVELEAYSCPGNRVRSREGRVRVRVRAPRGRR